MFQTKVGGVYATYFSIVLKIRLRFSLFVGTDFQINVEQEAITIF